jgi:hypothetical protein
MFGAARARAVNSGTTEAGGTLVAVAPTSNGQAISLDVVRVSGTGSGTVPGLSGGPAITFLVENAG